MFTHLCIHQCTHLHSFALIRTHSYSFVYPSHTHHIPIPCHRQLNSLLINQLPPQKLPIRIQLHRLSFIYFQNYIHNGKASLNTLLSKLPTHPVLRPYVFEQFVILQRCTRCSVTARRNRKISTWRRITGIPSRAAKTDVTGPTGYTSC